MIPQDASVDIEIVESQPSLTWGIDFEQGIIIEQIDELDAVKQAVFLTLSTERFVHEIYSWDYASEFANLIGTPAMLAYPEIERRVKEALLVDDRVRDVSDFTFSKVGDAVTATFTVYSTYGNFTTERTVTI